MIPRFDVVFTVRSPTKGDKVLASYPEVPRKKLSYVLVEDITANDAFHAVSLASDTRAILHL